MKQTMTAKTTILVFCVTMATGLGLWSCANQSKSLQHQITETSATADSSAVGKLKKKTYLKVKFHQNDTDVELVLDPEAQNLALDFVRGPDGKLQVFDGDSSLINNEKEPELTDGLLKKLQNKKEALDKEDLTDEIVQDINEAQRLFYQKEYEQALKVLQASLEKRKSATAYALGGSIYYVNGDIEDAVNAWENALKINPDLPDVKELVARYKQ